MNYPTASWDEARWRLHRWFYCRITEILDGHIGELLDVLRASGDHQDTLIVFTSDHGDGNAHHQWNQKQILYDEAARVYLPDGLKKNVRLLDALRTYPCLPGASKEKFFQLVLECHSDDYSEERWDQPVSFEIDNRKFHKRFVKKEWIPRPEEVL